jgi:hypothetical protein
MSISGIASTLFPQFDTTAAQPKFQHIKQGFQQLGQDLQSGNHGHHHHHGTESQDSSQSSSQQTAIQTLFSQLGQSLQTGNLSGAQQAIPPSSRSFSNQASAARRPPVPAHLLPAAPSTSRSSVTRRSYFRSAKGASIRAAPLVFKRPSQPCAGAKHSVPKRNSTRLKRNFSLT